MRHLNADLQSKGHHLNVLRRAIELSDQARRNGNDPFGALLADEDGNILLEAENSAVSDRTTTAHAEMNLVSDASQRFTPDELSKLTLYSSCEPCAMCAGAIFFTGIRRIMYALSGDALAKLWKEGSEVPPALLDLECRYVFSCCKDHPTQVVGPLLEEEALIPHANYWERRNRNRFHV